jgi:Amt family ammonium transporter
LLFFGNPAQLGVQCIAVAVTIVYAGIVSYILPKLVDRLFGLRVTEQDEISGLDLSQHNETAYTI